MKSLKLLLLGALSLSLAACGGPSIQNKEDAAKVLQRMESMGAASSTLKQGLTQNLVTSATVNLSGYGGSASCKVTVDMPFLDDSAQMTIDVDATMDNFSPDGKNAYSGTEQLHWSLNASATGGDATASVVMTVKADMKVAGEYNNHVTADITMTLSASAIAATGGTVTMTLDGTITADGTTYTYDNETIEVSATL